MTRTKKGLKAAAHFLKAWRHIPSRLLPLLEGISAALDILICFIAPLVVILLALPILGIFVILDMLNKQEEEQPSKEFEFPTPAPAHEKPRPQLKRVK